MNNQYYGVYLNQEDTQELVSLVKHDFFDEKVAVRLYDVTEKIPDVGEVWDVYSRQEALETYIKEIEEAVEGCPVGWRTHRHHLEVLIYIKDTSAHNSLEAMDVALHSFIKGMGFTKTDSVEYGWVS